MKEQRPDLDSLVPELTNLNLDDLDIEELESRLELAAVLLADSDGCSNNGVGCGNNSVGK